MTHKSLRPYVTTGMGIAGAAMIAVVPAAPQLPEVARQLDHAQHRAVALTADLGDILTPYTDLITNTANNLASLGSHAFDFPILTQFFSDPLGSLMHIPDALIMLNTLLPSVEATSSGLPIEIGTELTPTLGLLLSAIGPFVTLGNAFSDLISQIFDFSDPLGALFALLGAPATLLDAFLNGHDGLDMAGIHLPVFNGLLAPGQPFDLTLTIGQLVDMAGLGNLTVGDLAEQAGLADMPVASVVTGVLDAVGVGDSSITDLADQFGLGDLSLSQLMIGLLDTMGIGNPTISGLADQAGLGEMSVASLLIEVLNQVGMGTNQSMTSLAMSVLEAAGYGSDPTVGSLAVALMDAMGMGNLTITGLVQQFGVGDMTLGDVLKEGLHAVAGGDPTITGLMTSLGMGDTTIGSLLTSLLDSTGYGQLTPVDLLDSLMGTGSDVTLSQLLVNMIQGQGMDYTLVELLQQIPNPADPNTTYADLSLGELLNQTLVPPADPAKPDPVLDPYAGQPLGSVPWADFLASNMAMNYGAKTIQDLAAEAGMPLDSTTCSLAIVVGIDCSATLSSLMGSNTVYQTLHNLHADGNGIAGVPAGTPLTDVNLGQLVAATGQGDEHLSTILFGLHMDTTLHDIMVNLGLDDVTVNDIVTNGLPWLVNTTLVSLLSSWGLNNLDLDTVIDRLGLDMTVTQMLNSLGLGSIHVTDVVNDLLGGVHIENILNDLGLGGVTLETFLNNLLGGVYVGNLLDDLNLDNVHLDDVLTALLGGVNVNSVLTSLGLDNVHLDDVVNDLLGGTTIGTILDDLGISGATVTNILGSLGLNDTDVLGVVVGDFFGLFAQLGQGIPQMIADALAG